MASDAPTPHITLTSVALSDVRMNEHVALEVTEDGIYDTTKHPRMCMRKWPLYQREESGWLLLNTYGDDLFLNTGSIRKQETINAFLSKCTDVKQYADFDIEAYNAQAGEDALVAGSDYTVKERCNLPKTVINGKTYYIIDGCTYLLHPHDIESVVDVVSFDNKRVPEIEEEEDKRHNELMAKRPRRLSVTCELGQLVTSVLARDSITLQYDMECNVYAVKQAANTRLYLLYAADKTFFAQMTPFILKCHTSPKTSDLLYLQIDNTTISISALLLEWMHVNQEARSVQRQTLLDYNLSVVSAGGHVHSMHDTEYKYIEVEMHDYARYCRLFNEALGREPHADFLY